MAIEHRGFEHNYIANATKTVEYRFVVADTDPLEVDDSGAGGVTLGIRNGIPTADKPEEVLTIGQIAKLTLGTGGATIGNFLKAGSLGEGIVGSTDKDWIGAIALETGLDTQVISVLITGFTLSTT